MNENKANQILGNIEQLTETLAVGTNEWIAREQVKYALAARNESFWAALNPYLADIRKGMATSETADAIEAIVKEIL